MNTSEKNPRGLLPQHGRVPVVNSPSPADGPETQTLATRDPAVIQQWAAKRQARPATGQQTASGPSTTASVNDGGAGIRFNFPGASLFRDISWEEWFTHLREHDLLFVYEERTEGGNVSNRYRLVHESEWEGQFAASPPPPADPPTPAADEHGPRRRPRKS